MHHANTSRNGVIGRFDLDRFSVDENFAFVWHVQTVDQIHQCAFAGSILSEQGVNLTFAQVKVDIVTG